MKQVVCIFYLSLDHKQARQFSESLKTYAMGKIDLEVKLIERKTELDLREANNFCQREIIYKLPDVVIFLNSNHNHGMFQTALFCSKLVKIFYVCDGNTKHETKVIAKKQFTKHSKNFHIIPVNDFEEVEAIWEIIYPKTAKATS